VREKGRERVRFFSYVVTGVRIFLLIQISLGIFSGTTGIRKGETQREREREREREGSCFGAEDVKRDWKESRLLITP
jgi:hypothetical protein